MSELNMPVIISDAGEVPPIDPPTPPVEPATPAAVPVEAIVDDNAPPVVMAPVSHGRSFVLRQFYNSRCKIGQMLVLVSRFRRDTAIEVVETFFPQPPERKTDPKLRWTRAAQSSSGKSQNRFYMGDRKIPKDQWPLIFEIRVSSEVNSVTGMDFRMLYLSGKEYQTWTPLDLAMLKLRTTEEQRAHISAFTGIIYKIRTAVERHPKQMHRPASQNRRQPAPRMGTMFDRAGVQAGTVKHKLKENAKHVGVRSDLHSGLPSTPPPEAVLPARENLPPAVPEPAPTGDVADHGVSA